MLIVVKRIALAWMRLSLAGIFAASLLSVAEAAELDGVWQGTAETTSCLGRSVVNFQVSGNTLSGTWTTKGGSIFPNKTEQFSATLSGGGRFSTSFGAGSFFLSVSGNLNYGEGGGVVMNPGQSLCMSVWQAKKVAALPVAVRAEADESAGAKADPPEASPAAAPVVKKRRQFSEVQTLFRHLKRLVEEGLISEEEAAAKRQELLDEL